MSLRVVHVSPYLHPAWAYGNVPREVFDLARAQAAAGHSVAVLTTDAHAPHERLPTGEREVEGVRVVRVPNVLALLRDWLGLSTPVGMRRQARRLLADRNGAVVHLHELRTVENFLVITVIPGSVPVVLSTHGSSIPGRRPPWVLRVLDKFATGRVLARVDHVIVSSNSEEDSVRALADGRHVRLAADQFSVAAVEGAARPTAWPDRAAATERWPAAAAAVEDAYQRARRHRSQATS